MAKEEPDSDAPLIITLLLQQKKVDLAKVEAISREQAKRNCSIEEAIVSLHVVSDLDIAKLYAEHLDLPLIEPGQATVTIDDAMKRLLPERFMRPNHILALSKNGDKLRVAFLNPADFILIQETQLYSGLEVEVCAAPLGVIEQGLDALYGASTAAKEMAAETQNAGGEAGITGAADKKESDVLNLDLIVPETKDTKVIRLVNHILTQAIREKASDIHLEPYPEEIRVRLRIDGGLNNIPSPPVNLYNAIISRFKILSKMDISEKRIPLDGAFSMMLDGKSIDVRVSSLPTVHGEKMVMRLLNKEAVPLKLELLGFDPRQCSDFMEAARSPHGLLFVTGPTGSGKSTTLYATLNLVNSPRKNILTVEDPVEYKFVGINQCQVKVQVDLTFARALRAFLRQDPDVIMVGEVRDNETAQICLRAALTGHFVLSTLHTNSALSATTRLADMGIEPFLIASTLRLVEAQRLIRRLCTKCKEPYNPDAEMIDKYQLDKNLTIYRPKGCSECRDIGYKGRVGIFEVFRIIPELRDMIQEKAPLPMMDAAARKAGMSNLTDNGLVKVREGLTSLEEVASVSGEG